MIVAQVCQYSYKNYRTKPIQQTVTTGGRASSNDHGVKVIVGTKFMNTKWDIQCHEYTGNLAFFPNILP